MNEMYWRLLRFLSQAPILDTHERAIREAIGRETAGIRIVPDDDDYAGPLAETSFCLPAIVLAPDVPTVETAASREGHEQDIHRTRRIRRA